jgi:ech hydrogenase subunit D
LNNKQEIVNISLEQLLDKVRQVRDWGYRLVQICCTKSQTYEINYSFDKDYSFLNLKLTLDPAGAKLPSISGIYWSAFIYENEMHDLFGIEIKDMAVDYAGTFYRTKVKFPFISDTDKKDA